MGKSPGKWIKTVLFGKKSLKSSFSKMIIPFSTLLTMELEVLKPLVNGSLFSQHSSLPVIRIIVRSGTSIDSVSEHMDHLVLKHCSVFRLPGSFSFFSDLSWKLWGFSLQTRFLTVLYGDQDKSVGQVEEVETTSTSCASDLNSLRHHTQSLKNAAIEKKASLDSKPPSGVLALDPPVIADLPSHTTYKSDENRELERGISANVSCDAVLLLGKPGADTEGVVELNSTNDAEIIWQEQAATKARMAFRGYLGGRAIRALKGIISLLALIHGHLARRQAVATLHCMQAIVKFQALVCGRQV